LPKNYLKIHDIHRRKTSASLLRRTNYSRDRTKDDK